MNAIEFETKVNKSSILIPQKFNVTDKTKVKVILLYEKEPETAADGNYNKHALLRSFEAAKRKKVFKNIENAVDWQKRERDDWQ